MPTYDYRCDACGHKMDLFQGIKEAPLKKCPSCGKNKLRRLIGSGAGIIFKGSGFYETDYKRSRPSSGGGGGASKESKDSAPKSEGESKPARSGDTATPAAPSTPPATDSKKKKRE